MRSRSVLVPLVAAVAMLLVVGRWVSASVVSHAWFTSLGVPSLFWERVIDGVLLQGGVWLLGSGFAFANLHAVRRTILAIAMPVRVGNLELTAMIPGRRLTVATALLAMIVAALLAIPLSNWEVLAMARHGVPFGEIEGITGRDLGFFVYWLPFEETLYLWALVTVVTVTSMVLVLYALTRSLRVQGRRLAVSTHVRRHVSVLGALVLLLLAWSYRLDAYDLLTQGSGPDGLFLRVDHQVTLRMDLTLAGLCALAAPILLRTGWMGQFRVAMLTLSLVLGAAFVCRHVVPAIVARSTLLGPSPARDRAYIASRAVFSRRAFDVDAMFPDSLADSVARPLPVVAAPPSGDPWASVRSASLYSVESLRANARGDLIPSVRSSDSSWGTVQPRVSPTADAMQALDARPGTNVPYVGWQIRAGRLAAVLLQPPLDRRRPWSISTVAVDAPILEGVQEPSGPRSRGPWGWPVVAPQLSTALIMSASEARDVTLVPLRTMTARLAHAWALRDFSVLRAHQEVADPAIVTTRDVRERVQRVMPVLVLGREVTPLYDGTRVVWSIPLYAASDRYPLSQRWAVTGGTYGYFRLAGVAFADAQTGVVRIVPEASPDPIMKTWMRRVPQLMATPAEIGAALIAQVPPAYERVLVQIHTFARYGARSRAGDGGATGRRLPDGVLEGGVTPPLYIAEAEEGGRRGPLRWAVPLVNGAEQVEGIVEAFGGREPGSRWVPLPGPHARWRAMVPDSTRPSNGNVQRLNGRTGSAVRTPSVIPVPGGLLVWERLEATTAAADRGPRIRATVSIKGTVQRAEGRDLREIVSALGGVDAGREDRPAVGRDDQASSRSPLAWYERMRAALQRGEWSAFGAALDSLGSVLQRRGESGGARPP